MKCRAGVFHRARVPGILYSTPKLTVTDQKMGVTVGSHFELWFLAYFCVLLIWFKVIKSGENK